MPLESTPTPSPVSERTPADLPVPLRVVIAYEDDAAYKRVLRLLVRVTDPERDEVRPLPWRFDVLRTITGRISAALELAKSHVFVVSANGRDNFPPGIEEWLRGTFGGLRGSNGLMIALLGAPGRGDEPHSPRLKLLRGIAEHAGWDFLAPAPPAPPRLDPSTGRSARRRAIPLA